MINNYTFSGYWLSDLIVVACLVVACSVGVHGADHQWRKAMIGLVVLVMLQVMLASVIEHKQLTWLKYIEPTGMEELYAIQTSD